MEEGERWSRGQVQNAKFKIQDWPPARKKLRIRIPQDLAGSDVTVNLKGSVEGRIR